MNTLAPTNEAYGHAFGATCDETGNARFYLWAPAANKVELMLDGHAMPMPSDERGGYVMTCKATAGTAYRYRIDGDVWVPDPASRCQQHDVHGASVLVEPHAFRWHNTDWKGRPWHEAIICEVHAGCLGGFDGVREKLAAMAEAGYTAIELMPIAQFPGSRNWGYDGTLLYAPHNAYGSPDALKQLIDEAHGLGLMVLLDVVYNHFGPEGNYLPRYAPAFFRDGSSTPWGAAIDFNRDEVRHFYLENALMWLHEYRFDGLRFDAVHAIEPRESLLWLAERLRKTVAADRHIHLIVENECNEARLLGRCFNAQWNDDGHNALHVALTSEDEGYYADFAIDPIGKLARVLGEGFAFQGERDRNGRPRGERSAGLAPENLVLFAQNHDQIGNRALGDRLATLIPDHAMRAATALIALSAQVPLFFMGDEWGCQTPFLYFTDYEGTLAEQVRDGRRAEFAAFSSFDSARARAAIPDPNTPETFEASIPRMEDARRAATWRAWFTQLLSVRKQHVVPFLSAMKSLGCDPLGAHALVARWSRGDGSIWQLAVNLGDRPIAWNDRPADTPVFVHGTDNRHGNASLAPYSVQAHVISRDAR